MINQQQINEQPIGGLATNSLVLLFGEASVVVTSEGSSSVQRKSSAVLNVDATVTANLSKQTNGVVDVSAAMNASASIDFIARAYRGSMAVIQPTTAVSTSGWVSLSAASLFNPTSSLYASAAGTEFDSASALIGISPSALFNASSNYGASALLSVSTSLNSVAIVRSGLPADDGQTFYVPSDIRTFNASEGAMIVGTHVKQPNEILDYDIVFTEWLPPSDEIDQVATAAISPSPATVTPSGELAIDTYDIDVASDTFKVWLSGGVSGKTYKVQVRIETSGGRRKEAELKIKVKEV